MSDATKQEAPEQVLEMSDEDFAKLNGPGEEVSSDTSDTVTDPNPNPEAEASGDDNTSTAEAAEASAAAASAGGEVVEEPGAEAKTPAASEANPEAKSGEGEKSEETPGAETKSGEGESAPVDHEAFYNQIMKPFRANGKLVELRTPEEAIQLMQMGANYTRKLQDLQPHRKMLMMLQNNDLLDEGKLSFLIDVSKKDPEAIKKLIKDAGIDPLDIDPNSEPAYLPGSHTVSDKEADFRTALGDLKSTPDGEETVKTLSTLDQVSKQALWDDPSIMTALHEQRQSGVYAVIVDEVERRRSIGSIPASTPFLQAYKQVGDELVAQAGGPGGGQSGTDPAGEKTPQVVAHRAATPKPTVKNGEKAAAASPTKIAGKKAEAFVNPLSQSDDEFLKTMDGRV
jgi:hypothetical protein